MNQVSYFVVKHADIDALCRHVNRMLIEGWALQGGIAICDVQTTGGDGSHSERHYAQAMTRTLPRIRTLVETPA